LSVLREFENDRRRNELAIHCALNRVDKSTDIEPLGLNLARRRESACIQAERRQNLRTRWIEEAKQTVKLTRLSCHRSGPMRYGCG
jgi:hypothetical protein